MNKAAKKSLKITKCNNNPQIKEGQKTQCPKETNAKGQTTIYKAVHRQLKIEQHELH